MSVLKDLPRSCAMEAAFYIILSSGFAVAAAGEQTSQVAARAGQYAFDIPTQNLESALQAMALAANGKVLYRPELLSGKRSGELKGTFTTEQAVQRILLGTDLTYEFTSSSVVLIRPLGEKEAKTAFLESPGGDVETAVHGGVQIAQAENSSTSPASGEGVPKGADEGGKESSISEIIVSAQRREENLQDVPISISVLSGRQLDSSTNSGLIETLRSLPGVTTLTGLQTGGSTFGVRGVVGAPSTGQGPSPVAYYIDGVPFGNTTDSLVPDVNIYDLERVEVLRGPQGTLYGASALNGVVRVLTHEADLDKFELKARGLLSTTAHGGENGRADVAVNVPIVEGKLAARAIASYQDLSGWIDRPTGEDRNTAESTNLRLKVAAQPTDNLSVLGSIWVSRSDYGAPSFSPDNRVINLAPVDEPITSDFDMYGLTIGYDFPGFSLTSVTSHIDQTSHNFLFFAGTTNLEYLLEADITSQEITLNSTAEGPWRWTLGGIYRDAKGRGFANIPGLLLMPVDGTVRSESYAVFGEVTRLFFEGKLELTAGLRDFEDQLTTNEIAGVNFVGQPLTPAAGVYDRPKFDAVTPRVVLTWHPDEDLTVYGSYSEGFRSGRSQGVFIRSVGIPPVQPDRLHNYEIGMKGDLWNGRVNFDSALYYIDWQDVQQTLNVVLLSNPTPVYGPAAVNSGSASGLGFEVAGTARLTDRLTLGVGYGWNDLTFDTNIFSNGIPLFFAGSRLNYSPEETSSVSVSYDFPLGESGFEGHFAASANSVSALQTRRLFGTTVFVDSGDPMLISRFSFSLGSPAGWSATLFADNLTNEEDAFINNDGGFPDRDMRTRPRTVGVQFEFNFR